jgi:hypothetical protein
VLASGVAMQAFLCAAAACFALADRGRIIEQFGPGEFWSAFGLAQFVTLECLVWGTFWSLQTARPVQAIFKTIATLIVIFMVSGLSLDWARMHGLGNRGVWYGAFDTWGWLRTAWTVAVFAASWVLGARWLDGRAFEWEAVFARLFRRRIATRKAVREWSEPWQRTWQRLWWLEMQSLKSFGWMTVAATVLACVSILFGERPTIVWAVFLGGLLIVIGSLQSWRGEQTQQQYRLLVNHGVSPLGVWANKLLLWFTATVLAVGLLAVLSVGSWELLSAWEGKTLSQIDRARWPSLIHQYRMNWSGQPDVMRTTTAVIAFGLTIIMAPLSLMWLTIVFQLGMPLAWFAAPLPVWLLLVSLRHLSVWWVERTGWRVWLVRGVELTLVPLLLMAGTMAYRVCEVPWVSDADLQRFTPIQTDAAIAARNRTAWQQLQSALAALPRYWEREKNLAMGAAAAEFPEPLGSGPELMVEGAVSAAHVENVNESQSLNQWLQVHRDSFLKLRDAVLALGDIPTEAQIEGGGGVFPLARLAVLEVPAKTVRARVPEVDEQGDVPNPTAFREVERTYSESVTWLQAAVRLGGLQYRNRPFLMQRNQSDHVFAAMLAWADHPQQTEETLRRGLAVCSHEVRHWQVTPTDVLAELAWEEEQSRHDPRDEWSWEVARQERLRRVEAMNRLTYLNYVQIGMIPAGFGPQPLRFGNLESQAAWEYSPIEQRWRYGDPRWMPVWGLERQTVMLLHDAETRYRATVATMAIVGFRRLHGRLPMSLTEVAPLFGPVATSLDVLRDPWSRGWFRYEPNGFPMPADSAETLFTKPLLWSVGPHHISIQPTTQGLRAVTEQGTQLTSGFVTERNLDQLMVFPIPPQSP